MTQVYERVNVSKIVRDLEVGEKAIFGTSFNILSLRQTVLRVQKLQGAELKMAEVPEGFMIWRKA